MMKKPRIDRNVMCWAIFPQVDEEKYFSAWALSNIAAFIHLGKALSAVANLLLTGVQPQARALHVGQKIAWLLYSHRKSIWLPVSVAHCRLEEYLLEYG